MSAILKQAALTMKRLANVFDSAQRFETLELEAGLGRFILVSDEMAQEIAKTLQATSSNIEVELTQASNEVERGQ